MTTDPAPQRPTPAESSGRLKAARTGRSAEPGRSAVEMKAQVVALRAYRPDEADALLAPFRDMIRRVNVRGDAPDQIRAWASDDMSRTPGRAPVPSGGPVR